MPKVSAGPRYSHTQISSGLTPALSSALHTTPQPTRQGEPAAPGTAACYSSQEPRPGSAFRPRGLEVFQVLTAWCPFTSRLTRARFGIWIWAGAELTRLDLTPSCSALPGNLHHLVAAQTCYHELCFRQKHAVTCFKNPQISQV